MRIWDINPGYLNRQSLLGEHRELHGIVSILVNNKKGYSKHPETVRWKGRGWALKQRHSMLADEMSLRSYKDNSPVTTLTGKGKWPETYIDEPFMQLQILGLKYADKEQGRIPLPKSAQHLWSHHKYSVLARDVSLYKELGRKVSAMTPRHDFSGITLIVTELLRTPPPTGGLRNALQHMWGHVSGDPPVPKGGVESWPLSRLLLEVQKRAFAIGDRYLICSTALAEFKRWV